MSTLIDKYKAKKKEIQKRYGSMKPEDDKPPRFPGKLSGLSDEEIIDYMSIFTEWQVYAGVNAGEADADRKFAENNYKRLKKEKMDDLLSTKYAGKKDVKKFEVEAEADADPSVFEIQEKFTFNESTYKMEKSYKEGFERLCFVLSRELTRRFKSAEAQVRKESLGYRDDEGTNRSGEETLFNDWDSM